MNEVIFRTESILKTYEINDQVHRSLDELDWEKLGKNARDIEECFSICKNQNLNSSLRIQLIALEKLSQASRAELRYISMTKSWRQWFLSFIVYSSEEEKKLYVVLCKINETWKKTLIKDLVLWNPNYKACEILLNYLPFWLSFFLTKITHPLFLQSYIDACYTSTISYQQKYCAFRLLGEYRSEYSYAHGDSRHISIQQLINDLKNFLQMNVLTDDKDVNQIKMTIARLECAYFYAKNLNVLRSVTTLEDKKKCTNELVKCIKENCEILKVNESVLFPGGFVTHGILFEIKRTEKGFLLSLFNTGAESDIEHSSVQKTIGFICGKMGALHFGPVPLDRVVNENILSNIFLCAVTGDNITTLVGELKEQFGNPAVNDLYDSQVNGTCAYSCLLFCIAHMLPNPLFQFFMIHETVLGFKNIPTVNFEGKDELIDNGKKTLQKRLEPFRQGTISKAITGLGHKLIKTISSLDAALKPLTKEEQAKYQSAITAQLSSISESYRTA